MSDQIDYNKLFTDIIKKQITVLGPDITLSKVSNVTGISVDDTGTVSKLDGDPHQLLQSLTNEFLELSSDIVKQTIDPVLADYPEVASKMEQMASQVNIGASTANVSSLDMSQPSPVNDTQRSPVSQQPEASAPSTPNTSPVQAPAPSVSPLPSSVPSIPSTAPVVNDTSSAATAENISSQTTELSSSQSPGAPVADEANDTQLKELNAMFKDPTMTTSSTPPPAADMPPTPPTQESKKQ